MSASRNVCLRASENKDGGLAEHDLRKKAELLRAANDYFSGSLGCERRRFSLMSRSAVATRATDLRIWLARHPEMIHAARRRLSNAVIGIKASPVTRGNRDGNIVSLRILRKTRQGQFETLVDM